MKNRNDCGKVPYASEKAAKQAINQLRNNRVDKKHVGPLAPYVCPICASYHVGHKAQKIKTINRKKDAKRQPPPLIVDD